MSMLAHHRVFFRCVSLLTIISFLPSSVQAWYFLPQAQAVVMAADDGPLPLPAKKLEHLAANTDGAVAPLPLSEDKKKQLAAGNVAPTQVAQAEGVVGNLTLGITPDANTPALKTLSREELNAVASAPTALRPLRNPRLLEAETILTQVATAEKATSEEKSAQVKVAQAGDGLVLPETKEVRGPLGPQEAADALDAADTLADAGQRSDALIAYMDIMDSYGRSNEGLWADQGMWNTLDELADGRLGREAVTAFEAHLTSWAPQTADGAYAALTWDSERALAEHKRGETAVSAIYTARAEAACLSFLQTHGNNYLSMSAADYYQEMVNLQGPEKEKTAMRALWEQARAMESGPGRLGALYAFGSYASSVSANAAADSINAWSNVVKEIRQPYVDGILNDSTIPFWVKGFVCEYAGRAMAGLGRYEEAKAWYDTGVTLSTHVGPTHHFLAFMSALVSTKMHPMNPEIGVEAVYGYLIAYPDSHLADRAYVELGALFTLAGDYQGAAQFYENIIQRNHDVAMVAVAEHELNYLLRNLYDSRPGYIAALAEETPEQRMARNRAEQLCGPMALSKLLGLLDVDTEVSELADMAGTTETGTSMLGLLNAADAKGLSLSGVLADTPEELTLPAIAYMDQSHFVTVLDVRPDGVDIYDPADGTITLDRSTFGSRWDGQALVTEPGENQRLTVAALTDQKGGAGTPQLPSPNYTPYEDYVGGSGGTEFSGNSPSAIAQGPNMATPVNSPGVSLSVNAYESCIDIRETDLTLGVRGPMEVNFGRRYINEKGYPRTQIQGRMGDGWTSNMAIYIKTGPFYDPGDRYEEVESLILQDSSGTARAYDYSHTSGGYTYFERTNTGQTEEKGIVVKAVYTRTDSQRKYFVEFPDGKEYFFSKASANENGYARLEYIKDAGAANTVTFLYDSASWAAKLTKVRSPLGDGRHFLFSYNASNDITKVELKANTTVLQTVTYAYNSSDQLTKVTDNGGGDITYTYGAQGGASQYIDSITDRAGKVTDLDWYFADDASGDWGAYKIDVSPPAGAIQIYERSVSSSVNTVAMNDGVSDLNKSVTTPLVGDGSRTRYNDSYSDSTTYDRWENKYDAGGDLTSQVDPNGTTQADYSYTDEGRISTVTNTDGNTSTFHYDSSGDLDPTKTTDTLGLDTDYEYDINGRITNVLPPSVGSSGIDLGYNGNGQITSMSDINGNSTTYSYDSTGRITSTTDPLSNAETTAYDNHGNITSVTDPDSNLTTMEYDSGGCGGCGGGGRLTKRTGINNNDTTYAYDLNGNMTSQTDRFGVISDFFYDDTNRVTKVERPSGSGSYDTMTYDEAGRVSTRTDSIGRTLTYYYDFQGNMTRQSDGIGTYVEYAYDALGRVSTSTDGTSNTTTNDYDDGGRLTKVTYGNGKIVKTFYDSTGRVTKVGGGSTGALDPTETFYDSESRVTKRTYTSGASTYDVMYHFDGDGEMTKMTDWLDGTNGLLYAYDGHSRLTRLTDYDGSHLDYSYDSRGRITSQNDYHGNVTSYTYNSHGLFSTITAPGSNVWSYSYDGYDRLTKKSLPNGMDSVYDYDGEGRLTAATHKDGSTVKEGFVYAYNANNEKTKVTSDDDSYWSYFYDGRKRLTKAERFDAIPILLHRFEYNYDGADNLLTKSVYDAGTTATTSTTYSYNGGNEQTAVIIGGTTTTQAYDAWGRLTSRAQGAYSATYAYRYGGKLYSITSDFPGEGDVTYDYGGDEKRRSRIAGSDETWYNWDAGWTVLSEEDDADGASGALKRTYRGRNGSHVDGTNPAVGAWKFYTHDSLGSGRSIWNSDKSLYASFEQTPYGELYTGSGSTSSISRRYTGHDWDETSKLYFAPYRHYQPNNTRWMTRDPLGSVDGPNAYAYVGGNPVMAVDPMGLMSGTGGWEFEIEENVEAQRRAEEERRRIATICNAFIHSTLAEIQGYLDQQKRTVTTTKFAKQYSEEEEEITIESSGVLVFGDKFKVVDSPIQGHAGMLHFNGGISYRKHRIRISTSMCNKYFGQGVGPLSLRPFKRLIAHEAGHAIRDFSRIAYLGHMFWNWDFWGNSPGNPVYDEERIADAFRDQVSLGLGW